MGKIELPGHTLNMAGRGTSQRGKRNEWTVGLLDANRGIVESGCASSRWGKGMDLGPQGG